MKKSVLILGWALAAVFVIGGISSPGLQTVFLLAAAVLVCPPFREKVKLPGKVWIPIVAILFLIGVLLTPRAERPEQPSLTDASSESENVEPAPSPAETEPEQTPVVTPGPEVSQGPASNPEASEPEPSEPEVPEESSAPVNLESYTLPCGAELQYFDSVRNDVTGLWRRSVTSDSLVPADYALEYYERMFVSDEEIHSIWNATLKTTTKITAGFGLLYVDTYEYVDGEEHDAKIMFSGLHLDERIIDLETGEVEEVPLS